MECSQCGTGIGKMCICKQLSAEIDIKRYRTLWIGNILNEHNEFTIKKLFDNDKILVENIQIKRNSYKGLGFALVLFYNETDVINILKKNINKYYGNFEIRNHVWSNSPSSTISSSSLQRFELHECELNNMPTLIAQLDPLTETQLKNRIQLITGLPVDLLAERLAYLEKGRIGKKIYLKEQLAYCYKNNLSERRIRYQNGTSVPSHLCTNLLNILINTIWPKKKSRKSVHADSYMVLGQTSVNTPFVVEKRYQSLWNAAIDILKEFSLQNEDQSEDLIVNNNNSFTASNALINRFRCTSLAVTRNFIGSPHVDSKDTTYQFAMSLGDFIGGELCVESCIKGQEINSNSNNELNSEIGSEVVIIDTHDRIAKVDGRYCHWVKDWKGKERYSVIWFCVDESLYMQPKCSVYDSLY